MNGDQQHPALGRDIPVRVALQIHHHGRTCVCKRSFSPDHKIDRGGLANDEEVGKRVTPVCSDDAEEFDICRIPKRDSRGVTQAIDLYLKHDRIGRRPLCP